MVGDVLVHRSRIEAPAEAVFRWHARPGALQRLTPPWERAELVEQTGGIDQPGSRVAVRLRLGPFSRLWVAEHRDYVEGRSFKDVLVHGPFARWEHTHSVEPDGDSACFLEDRIEYELPLGPLGKLVAGRSVRERLRRMFAYRHRVTAQDVTAPTLRGEGGAAMKVLVSGASGLVGSALVPILTTSGHEVVRLVRSEPRPGEAEVRWDPAAGHIDRDGLAGIDAVVHLAGETLMGRWTSAKKQRIRDSRAKGTRLLAETLASLEQPPGVFVSASAVGYYGDRGEDELTEENPPGAGFLAEVCREWEAATQPAADKGIRVVNLRSGVVLSPAGGALAQLLLPFRLGLGGRVGSGNQYMSWIALDDEIGAIHHALMTDSLQGPVNLVSPNPVTNREFTKTLGRVLGRPTIFPLPAFAARLVLGEMADELLLASQRARPGRLQATGFQSRFPELEVALRHLLGK